MPDQDGIKMADKAIADSKKLLESTGPKGTSSLATKSGHTSMRKPATPAAPAAPAPKMPSSGLLTATGHDQAPSLKANTDNIEAYQKAVPKMHKGGEVMEDGLKNLKKGEVVISKEKAEEGKKIMGIKDKAKGPMSKAMEEVDDEPKSEAKSEAKGEKKESKKEDKKESAGKKHNFHRTEIVHHPNGSHTTTHHFKPSKPSAEGKTEQTPEPESYASPDFASMQQGMQQNLGGGPQ